MTNIQLNTVEESLLITLTILLLLTILALLFIVFKKRSSNNSKNKQQNENFWHDFIIINSPDHMNAIKNNESPSFETSRHQTPSNTDIQQQQQHTSTPLTNNEILLSDNYSFVSILPQTPPPVYTHQQQIF